MPRTPWWPATVRCPAPPQQNFARWQLPRPRVGPKVRHGPGGLASPANKPVEFRKPPPPRKPAMNRTAVLALAVAPLVLAAAAHAQTVVPPVSTYPGVTPGTGKSGNIVEARQK